MSIPGPRHFALAVTAMLALLLGCAPRTTPVSGPERAEAREEVERLLDAWHRAAAEADTDGYWGLLDADAIFIGTDATERWTRAEFERLYRKHFEAGKAWSFVPRERHVYVSTHGDLAYFDEVLDTEKLGELRGSGVARRTPDGWRVAHYVLSVPVPNDLLPELVKKIAGHDPGSAPADTEPATVDRGEAPSAVGIADRLKHHVPDDMSLADIDPFAGSVKPFAPRRVRIGAVTGWLLLTADRESGLLGALLVVDAEGGKTEVRPVPVPGSAPCRIGGVFQGNADDDPELEVAIALELMPGVGPEAARCFPEVLVLDVAPGKTAITVESSELKGAALREAFDLDLAKLLP